MKTARLGGVLPFFFVAGLFVSGARSEGLCRWDLTDLPVVELTTPQPLAFNSPNRLGFYTPRCHNLLMSVERKKGSEVVLHWGQHDIGVPPSPPEFIPQTVRCKNPNQYLTFVPKGTERSGAKKYIKQLEVRCGSSYVAMR